MIVALIENDDYAEAVKDCLLDAGFTVRVFGSFLRATQAMDSLPDVELIISDVHLENGGNIFDFLKWVRSNSHLKKTLFVLFSMEPSAMALYLEDAVCTTARFLGANAFISMREFDAAKMRREIANLLLGSNATDVERSGFSDARFCSPDHERL